MCGFYAEFLPGDSPVRTGVGDVASILGALAHRGPDASGAFERTAEHARVRLVHARLKVRDLSPAAAQPMATPDGSRLVFNGELYDYDEVRDELAAGGIVFRSRSDTEVLLQALRRWGIAALERLRGMFAFGWWDASTRSLWLARDRFGIKPLYWAAVRTGGIAAASEVRALLAGGLVETRVDASGIASYFAYGSVWGRQTAVQAVESLEPGSWMRVSRDGVATGRYWTPRRYPGAAPRRPEDAVAEVRALLRRSVESQLAADVPVGVFLSGGLDSGAVLGNAAAARNGDITGFTIAFPAESARLDERQAAALAAARAGARHRVIELSPGGCLSDLPRIASSLDLPSIDGVNSWFVSKAVRAEGIVVALSGLGGDEVFAGYPHLRHAQLYGVLTRCCGRRQPFGTGGFRGWARSTRSQKLLMALASGGTARGLYATRRCLFKLPADLGLFRRELVERWAADQEAFLEDALDAGPGALQAQTVLELQNYMRNTLLRDTDCMSMAHALEVRVPLLDERLVEYVLSLPAGWRVRQGVQKPLLGEALGLPPSPPSAKQGFTLPFVQWLRGPMAPLVEACLDELPRAGELVDRGAARALWRRFVAGEDRLWTRVWSIWILDRWLDAIHGQAEARAPDFFEREGLRESA
jgi:asparagine synthase (glutamine-hydrolysing)